MSIKNVSVALVARALLCGSIATVAVGLVGPAIAQVAGQVTQTPAAAPTEDELAAAIQVAVTQLLAANPAATPAQIQQATQTVIATSGAAPAVVAAAVVRAQAALPPTPAVQQAMNTVTATTQQAVVTQTLTQVANSNLPPTLPGNDQPTATVQNVASPAFGVFANFVPIVASAGLQNIVAPPIIIGSVPAVIAGPYTS